MHRAILENGRMTRDQIIHEIKYWDNEASRLVAAMNAKLSGAQSASISQGGGSKSYTNYSITDFQSAISNARKTANKWRAQLRGLSPLMPMVVPVRRS